MGIPLAPPSVHAIDGVVYTFASPIAAHRTAWVVGAVLVALFFSGGSAVGLLFVLAALALAGWTTDRTVELVVGLHRLEVRTVRLGLFASSTSASWHELGEAALDGQHIVLRARERLPRPDLVVSAWAPIGQLAWVVGVVNAQIRRAGAPQLAEQAAFDLARLDQLLVASNQRTR